MLDEPWRLSSEIRRPVRCSMSLSSRFRSRLRSQLAFSRSRSDRMRIVRNQDQRCRLHLTPRILVLPTSDRRRLEAGFERRQDQPLLPGRHRSGPCAHSPSSRLAVLPAAPARLRGGRFQQPVQLVVVEIAERTARSAGRASEPGRRAPAPASETSSARRPSPCFPGPSPDRADRPLRCTIPVVHPIGGEAVARWPGAPSSLARRSVDYSATVPMLARASAPSATAAHHQKNPRDRPQRRRDVSQGSTKFRGVKADARMEGQRSLLVMEPVNPGLVLVVSPQPMATHRMPSSLDPTEFGASGIKGSVPVGGEILR